MLGGFPEFLTSKKNDVLINLFNDLIYRDIVVRHGLRNPDIVRELGVFLASNIGKVFSYNNLVKNFDLGSGNTVKTYISYFEDAFLFFAISRFSYSFQQQIKNPKKIYGIDTGLIATLSMSFSKDKGRLLENKVFIHLKRMGKEIHYYQQNGECDFIVSKNKHIEFAVQVCYELTPENLDRELNGLLEAMTELNLQEGYILTMDQQEQLEKNGYKIQVIPVWKWMTEQP
jgi:predicted AAA+ superfamily ATPase